MSGTTLVLWMLGAMALMCAAAALGFLLAGRPGMALAFAGYVAANIGFIVEAISK